MYGSTLAGFVLLGLVSAQTTTTDLFLVGFDQQSILGSVIASDATATTYSLNCANPGSDDCGVPSSFTFTQGPSTVHYKYTQDDTGATETIELGCQITNSVSGACVGTVVASVSGSSLTSTSSTTFTDGGSALGGMIVTITAGAAAVNSILVTATGSPTMTAAGGSATGSAAPNSKSSAAGVPMITRAPWMVGGAAAALAFAAM